MKVYVINIKDRADRLADFVRDFPSEVLDSFEIKFAKTGNDVTPPEWWGTTANRWALIENFTDILNEDNEDDVLICEDDCIFAPDFAEKYEEFMEAVPNDWQLLFIGGGHNSLTLCPPKQVNEKVLQCGFSLYNHCIAIRSTYKQTLRSWLLSTSTPWECYHAQDNRIAELTKNYGVKAYAPMRFIAGQRGGTASDLGVGARQADNFFNEFSYIDLEGNVVHS